jgi:hypothetical protein
LHALDVASWSAVALIHVTATNPLCSGRHPDLITHAVIPDRSTGGVAPMCVIIARLRRIVAAMVVHAVMDGVMPIVIVIDVLTVPTTVVRFKRIVGSYSYWQVGQYTRFAGVEREPQDGVHFCGEHTSIDAQGYLEGAVETGERVANEIISALR